MIEVSGIRIPLGRLGDDGKNERREVRRAVSKALRIDEGDITSLEPRKRSIDARKSNSISLLHTVRVTLRGHERAERKAVQRLGSGKGPIRARMVDERPCLLPARGENPLDQRPLVVGAGCAGLFCALALAHAGLSPILIERGDDATRRTQAVRRFEATGELDEQSNIQFGVGGAGTFSDGKLSTGTKSPSHRLILETLVDAGAAREILWDAKPHVGSDVLPGVVTKIVARIEEYGGEVWLRSRLADIETSAGRIVAATVERTLDSGIVTEVRMPVSHVVLACGHSARDVFCMLQERGVLLERKPFSVGVRIEHLQRDIDRALYGHFAGHPALGAAPYKLVAKTRGGRNAYTFCMCPGGHVVAAASEAGGVVTNGMSLSARDGTNANSALLVNVNPDDLPGEDVLEGIRLQRELERAAFEAGGGGYVAPAQLLGDFLQGVSSSAAGSVAPTYPRGVRWGDVRSCLPEHVTQTLQDAIPLMGRQIYGFDAKDAVLTGVESRSSSPVRVTRDASCQSVSCRGLWPAGEGAGYAGGIMSAAADGLRVAQNLIAHVRGEER